MDLRIDAFPPQTLIPSRFSADGADLSPGLAWENVPSTVNCFALIVEDPDAPVGLWIHWLLYDLPGTTRGLAENQPKEPELPSGGRQGRNSWGRLGYNGPAPPPGKTHRYYFKLYALSAPTGLAAGATKAELERAMVGKVLDEASWMGTYRR
jgi:hypothetical protein